MRAKGIKLWYVALALLAALGAIVASYFREYYVALALIVLASVIILAGSLLVSRAYRSEKAELLKKL